MFKCKECGTEYEIKPEYCDCGNDTFEEIISTPKVKQEIPQIPTKPSIKKETQTHTKTKIEHHKKTFDEQYPELVRFKESLDPISLIIFITCIILSVAALMFMGKTDDKTVKEKNNNAPQEKVVQNIPSINSYWDDTPVKPEIEEIPTEPEPVQNKLVEEIKQIIPIVKVQPPKQTNKQTVVQKPIQKPKTVQTTAPKSTSKRTVSSVKTNNTTKAPQTKSSPVPDYSSLTKRVQNNLAKTAQNTQPQNTNKVTTPKSSQTVNVATLPTITTNTPKVNTNVVQKQTAPAKTSQQIKQELSEYKANLRNIIGRKIDFTKVVGDGECVVSFKINSSGKLTNRVFSKQSSNLTLNDAVYTAVNSTPSYSTPPTGYNGETLNLKIKFYNGNFEISLY